MGKYMPIQFMIQSELIYTIAIVFFMGAVPWLEVWVAIPVGIAMGLNPVVTFIAAVIGNYVSLITIVATYHRAQVWYKGRFSLDTAPSTAQIFRRNRFKKLWNRYGLPVVALAAPVVIGTHLASILAMIESSSWKNVLLWMAVSLIFWSTVVLIAGFYSIEFIRSIFLR